MSNEIEKTLALIKPDAVKAGKADEIKQLIELHGFTIVAQQKLQLTRARAEEFYGEHYGKPFFNNLVSFMTSGPVWAIVLAKPDAIKQWRGLMGPTNCFKAREEAPRSLRALYGTDGTQNATHGSDSPASAAREIKFFFPGLVLEPVMDAVAAKVYIAEKLQPALSRALTALAREKPSADKFEAITFLSTYLLSNNPNKPRILTPDEWDPSIEEEDDEAEFAQARLLMVAQQQAAADAKAAADKETADRAEEDAKMQAAAAMKVEDEARAAAKAEAEAQAAYATAVRKAAEEAAASEHAAAMAAANAARATSIAARPPSPGPQPVLASSLGTQAPTEHEEAAATTIQAAVRGHEARKEVTQLRGDDVHEQQQEQQGDQQEQEEQQREEQPGQQLEREEQSEQQEVLRPLGVVPTSLQVKSPEGRRAQIIEAVFTQLDRDGSGFVEKQELRTAVAGMQSLVGEDLSNAVELELSKLDSNQDDKVSIEEFITAMGLVSMLLEDDVNFVNYLRDTYSVNVEIDEGHITATAGFSSRTEVLESVFARVDRDGSGYIDKEEMRRALAHLGTLEEGRAAEGAQHEIDAMDANSDSHVSKEEFLEHFTWLTGVLDDDEFIIYLEEAFNLRVRYDDDDGGRSTVASKHNVGGASIVGAQDVPPTVVEEDGQAPAPEGGAEQHTDDGGVEDLPDIDNFTEAQVAAVTRIQAAGRGMLDRKKVNKMKLHARDDEAAHGQEDHTLTTELEDQEELGVEHGVEDEAVMHEPSADVADETL